MHLPQTSSGNQIPQHSLRNYVLLFTVFFTITFLVYLPALHSGFVFDFINMVFDFRKGPGLFDFSKGIQFDFINRFVFKAWLKLWGYNAWAWHFLQCFLHSINGVFLYALMGIMLRRFQFSQVRWLSLLTALCFLLNPYQTEPLVWGGDLNYLLVGNFILLSLLAFAHYLQNPKNSYLVIAALALIAGAFTHELGWFILPADVVLAIFLAPELRAIANKNNLKFWAAAIVLMALYFGNKLLSGELLGHYGSAVHLRFQPAELISAFFKYIFKIVLLGNFLPGKVVSKIYLWIDKLPVAALLFTILLITLVTGFLFTKKKPALKVPLALFLLFAIFVFPILNLYFPYWIKIHGDRYCYITSAFIVGSVITGLYLIRPIAACVYAITYLIASSFFLAHNISSWQHAATICNKLEKSYHWQNARQVYILNLPDNYRGAYMYRSKQHSQFASYFIKYGIGNMPDGNKITEVLNYNLNQPADSVTVQIVAPGELKVSLAQWGTWWWRNTLGATSYEDSLVKVHIDDYNHGYNVVFKQKQPGDIFIYSANGQWRQVPGF